MKKIINYISVFVCLFLMIGSKTFAASYDVSVTSNTVNVGNTVTLTINGADMAGRFDVTSSNMGVATLNKSFDFVDNSSISFVISTISEGTTVINIIPTDVTAYDKSLVTGSKSITITVVKPQTNSNSSATNSYVAPKVKSSNNNLTSITIDNVNLNEEFSTDRLEYTVTIPGDVEKININAQTADSTASVTGVGEQNLVVGENVFLIIVVAEDGSEKTYKITANVTELKNIEVIIDDKKYSVVRKNTSLDLLEDYSESTVLIDNENILCYHNDITNYDIVILKDEEDNYDYYLYKKGKYTLYKEHNFSGTRLFLIDDDNNTFEKVEFKLNDELITTYTLKNVTYALEDDSSIGNYYLVYGMNIKTGKESYYLIDKLENTAFRYSDDLGKYIMDITTNEENYKLYFFITLGVVGLICIITGTVLFIKKRKN